MKHSLRDTDTQNSLSADMSGSKVNKRQLEKAKISAINNQRIALITEIPSHVSYYNGFIQIINCTVVAMVSYVP